MALTEHTDEEAGTITISDHGIGMTKEELAQNLGTIARSGSKEFLEALKEKGDANASVIGQFGVGFYSAFMAADRVEVFTHSWDSNGGSLKWESDGQTGYTISDADDEKRGARIVIHLKEDEKDFAKAETLRNIIDKHSRFVSFPLSLNGECINVVDALWLKSKNEISEEDYKEFVDSEDLPLNISRETMQDSALVKKLNSLLTKRFLKHLAKQAKSEPEKYEEFFERFGRFLKEGIATGFENHEALAGLLRFESSLSDEGKKTSFEEYLTRAKDDQEFIYYLVGLDRKSLEAGPYLEAFQKRGIEVIFLHENIDDYIMESLREYKGKKLVSADRAEIELDELPDSEAKLSESESKALIDWLTEALGDKVETVEMGKRLVSHPVVALTRRETQ